MNDSSALKDTRLALRAEAERLHIHSKTQPLKSLCSFTPGAEEAHFRKIPKK